MQTAWTIADFFFQNLANQTDLSSTDGRARYVKLASDMLKQLPQGIFQQMMFEELAKKARIDVDYLKPKKLTQKNPSSVSKPLSALRQPSALRLAMTLLVQQPQLVNFITQALPKLEITGYDLFLQVVAQAKANPTLTTGQLLEYWRDKEEGKTLAKLAQWEHMIPEQGVQHEFAGAIKNLHKIFQEHNIENLLAKAAQSGLTAEEKLQLTELINNKK
jgi:DNA primase